jgi:hypothetical protein
MKNSILQVLMNAQNQPVKIPFGHPTKPFDCLCMTALPDDKSFALIGGCQFDYSGSVTYFFQPNFNIVNCKLNIWAHDIYLFTIFIHGSVGYNKSQPTLYYAYL